MIHYFTIEELKTLKEAPTEKIDAEEKSKADDGEETVETDEKKSKKVLSPH